MGAGMTIFVLFNLYGDARIRTRLVPWECLTLFGIQYSRSLHCGLQKTKEVKWSEDVTTSTRC